MMEILTSLTSVTPEMQLNEKLQWLALDIYDWVLVFALLFLLLEFAKDISDKKFSGARMLETGSSLFTQIPFYFAETLLFAGAVYLYYSLAASLPYSIEPSLISFIVVLLLADFTYYVEHYAMHRIRLLWVAHSVHHSSWMFNTATAFRFSIFDPIVSACFHLPLVLMGFDPALIFAAEILIQAYQFWLHNDVIKKLGPVEWVFNTPSHHRVHHGSDQAYIDKNFGGILIVWDRLFGTFAKETHTPTYGLTTPINTLNPFKVQFFEVMPLLNSFKRCQSVRDCIKILLKPPGWKPSHNSARIENTSKKP